MGNYNEYYKNYYSSMVKGKRTEVKSRSNSAIKKNNGGSWIFLMDFSKEGFIRKLIIRLIVVLVMFSSVLVLRWIKTDITIEASNILKKEINRTYNYESLILTAKNFSFNKVEEESIKIIEKIKSYITGKATINDKVKDDYLAPVLVSEEMCTLGQILNSDYKEDGDIIRIDSDKSQQIMASQCGRVKSIGNDKDNIKYIIINHGNGIETKYSNLNDVFLTKGQKVSKGQVIGTINSTKEKKGVLYFELLYMGERKNLEEFLAG